MSRLLVGDDPRFEVDAIEIDRGGLSYTVDTLAALAARWPDAELFWLVGADVLASFAKWREPERIVGACHARSDASGRAKRAESGGDAGPMPRRCATRRIDISSTEIRQRVRQGKSIRGFVPDAVAEYIAAERLYR